MVIIL